MFDLIQTQSYLFLTENGEREKNLWRNKKKYEIIYKKMVGKKCFFSEKVSKFFMESKNQLTVFQKTEN